MDASLSSCWVANIRQNNNWFNFSKLRVIARFLNRVGIAHPTVHPGFQRSQNIDFSAIQIKVFSQRSLNVCSPNLKTK